jgi:septin family protein
MFEDTKAGYRVKIILLKDDGYTDHEIRRMATNIMTVISESGLKIFYDKLRDNLIMTILHHRIYNDTFSINVF